MPFFSSHPRPVHQQVLNAISHASTSLCPQGHHGLPYPKVCPYISLLEPLPVRVEKGGGGEKQGPLLNLSHTDLVRS